MLTPPVELHRPPDEDIQAIILKLYGEGRRGCFVDVGANQGRIILNLLALGVDLSYLGFEPQLIGAYYIQQLIDLNGLSGYHIIAAALGSANSMATLYRGHPGDVSATYTLAGYSAQRFSEKIPVPVLTADSQLANLESDIFIVKIDTEGAEFEVLQGMDRTLQEKRPPVYFEVFGYRALLEGTYSREFNRGELPETERKRLIENRRANMEILGKFWRERGYTTHLCRKDGTMYPVESLDPGPQSDDNRGEMNFLAMPA